MKEWRPKLNLYIPGDETAASIRGRSLLTCSKMKSCRHEGTQAPSMSSSSSLMLVALDASGSRRRVLRFICAAFFPSCLHGCPSLCHHLCQFAAHCGSRVLPVVQQCRAHLEYSLACKPCEKTR